MELSGMRILLAGNDVSFIESVREALRAQSVEVVEQRCIVAADFAELSVSSFDLIIITQLYDPGTHDAFLKSVNTSAVRGYIPVFVLVDSECSAAETALLSGASDFVAVHESLSSIMEKIKDVYKSDQHAAVQSKFDITPRKANVTIDKIRVFVVEDDPLLRNLLIIKLDKSGFIYDFSESADHLKSRLIAFKPQVLILDLMLPGKNGFDIMKELRADEQTKHIPIIVFSNRDSQSDRERAHTLGAVGFYVKAMTDLSEFIELIEQYITS